MIRHLLTLPLLALALACAATPTKPDGEKPAPSEHEVDFEAAGLTIHGTLTVPADAERAPAILLIAGSGPTDRDWNSRLLPGTNGSAKLLADELARSGLVVLRYDKRGAGKTGVPKEVTWADYLAEQRAALELLRARPEVDPERIFVAGHSEGGAHALKLAQNEPVAGLVLLATAGRSLRDVVVNQLTDQLTAAQHPDAVGEATRFGEALDRIAAGEEVDASEVTPLAALQSLLRAFQAPESATFVRDLLGFDPIATLQSLKIPVLVISGEKDVQVDPEKDARVLAAARGDVELILLPESDHVFKQEKAPRESLTGAAALRYNAQDRALDPALAPAIVRWVQAH